MYQRLQEMIWARTYRSKIEDQLKNMPHTQLPGAPKFLFDSIESKIIRPVPLHHDDGQTPHLIHIIIIIIHVVHIVVEEFGIFHTHTDEHPRQTKVHNSLKSQVARN